MTNAPTDTIPDLLRLDPSNEGEAVRLRVGIATLAGWTEIEHREIYCEDYYDSGFQPELLGYAKPKVHDDEQSERVIPHFESSLAAAVTLIPAGTYFQLNTNVYYPSQWWAQIGTMDGLFSRAECENSPALAICRAWLQYKQAELARRENGSSDAEPGRTESEAGDA